MARKRRTYQKAEPVTKSKLVNSAKIFRFIRPYRWSFYVGLFLLSTSSLMFMIFPGAAGEMANKASGQPTKILDLELWQYGGFFLVLLILQGVTSYFRTVLFANVSEKGMADVRKLM